MNVMALCVEMMAMAFFLLVFVAVLQYVAEPSSKARRAKAPLSVERSLEGTPRHRWKKAVTASNQAEYGAARPFRSSKPEAKVSQAQPYVSYEEGKNGNADKLSYGFRFACAGADWKRPLVLASYRIAEQPVDGSPNMLSPAFISARRRVLSDVSMELLGWVRDGRENGEGQFSEVELLPVDIDPVAMRYLGMVEAETEDVFKPTVL